MEIPRIEKHFEEEITVERNGEYRVIKIRNVVVGNLNNEENKNGKSLKECSDKIYDIAKKLTERDIEKIISHT